MAERKMCGMEFAPGVSCSKDAGHDLPEYSDLDYGQWSERSSIVSDLDRKHRFEWVVPDPEPTAPEARRNLRSLVVRYLSLGETVRRAVLVEVGLEYGLWGGEALAAVRERGLIDEFAAAVDRRRPERLPDDVAPGGA